MNAPRTHFLIALAVAAAALAGYGVWYAAVSAKSAEVADIQGQIDAATENASRIAAARAALAEVAGDEAKVQAYFVSEAGIVAFINSLESLGLSQKAAVSVLSVSAAGTPARPTLQLSLSVKGAFDAVMRTVGAIEYAPYDLSISTLSVGQDAKNSWHADLSLTVGSTPPAAATSTP
ncbi:MAG TPA: hypothetical protein VMV62_02420 [Candidatus Paceibacterota bacterium]|nr:hypothetical protein [Candidatus Paceibacterota bacterium]